MSKFKVGDPVRVVIPRGSAVTEGVAVGDEGEVVSVVDYGARVVVNGKMLGFYNDEIEPLPPTPTLESRVSAAEQGLADTRERLSSLEAAVFPPTPQPDAVPWEAVELRPRTASRRDVQWFAPAAPVADVVKGRGDYQTCDIRDSRTGRVMLYEEFVASARAAAEAKPLTLGDVENWALGSKHWIGCGANPPSFWLDGHPYTKCGWKFRNKHTHAPITEDEFLAICRRERDGGGE